MFFITENVILLIISILLLVGLYVLFGAIFHRNSLKQSNGDLADLSATQVDVVRKGNSLTDEDAAFIQSCIHFRKGDD